MAKIRNPALFSRQFGIDRKTLDTLGMLDPVLNVDTRLFIDPLLLKASKHPQMKRDAVRSYYAHFKMIIKLLKASKREGDVAWKNAERYFTFPEIKATCLGYGASTIRGSAWGPKLRKQVLYTAKEIVDLGVDDPDLFMALALFEDGIGPDRISDMVTNVILKDLIHLNELIFKKINVPREQFEINGEAALLPRNPFESNRTPVILVPRDVLRDLPIALDWSDVGDAALKNQEIRQAVNKQIGRIWEAKSRKDKGKIKERALESAEAFNALLSAVKAVPLTPYDCDLDSAGQVAWTRLLGTISATHPLPLTLKPQPMIDEVFQVVHKIVTHFTKLVEDKGLWKELWSGNQPRHESSAQRIFFAVADSFCKANNIDVTPEANSGGGPVDFKFSTGYESRVLVEVKLSTNSNIVSGYKTQLEVYKAAEDTTRAIYLIVDVGGMGRKDEKVLSIKNAAVSKGHPVSDVVFVDAKPRESASKRKR